MFSRRALALISIARKKNSDRVQGRIGEAANPSIGLIPAGVAKDFCARHHALPEFFRECRQRFLVYSERAKSLPREGHLNPSLLAFDRVSGLRNGSDLVENSRKPGASLVGLMKGKEFITPREGGHAGYENVLKILDLKHTA